MVTVRISEVAAPLESKWNQETYHKSDNGCHDKNNDRSHGTLIIWEVAEILGGRVLSSVHHVGTGRRGRGHRRGWSEIGYWYFTTVTNIPFHLT